MGKLILGLVVSFSALAIACGSDDESPPASTNAPEEATATESANGDAGSKQTFSSSQLPIPVTVTAPEGWEQPADGDLTDIFVVFEPGVGYIDFLQPTQVYTYTSEMESEVGSPPADYVAWFNENPLLKVVETEEVTVGGLPGTRLEITNNENESFALFELSDGSNYDLSYLDHVYAHVLDADGTPIIVMCGPDDAANFTDFAETCEEILATVEFGP